MANALPNAVSWSYNSYFAPGHAITDLYDALLQTYVQLSDAGGSPYLQWDMGESYIMTTFTIAQDMFHMPLAANIRIRCSQDGNNWTDSHVGITYSETAALTAETATGRYWRIEGSSFSDPWNINDLSIEGAPGGGTPPSMDITPDPLWVGAGQTLMTATLTGESWTPGSPGSSTISADHGTVDHQWIDSATTLYFLYTPADYVGTITFTESEFSIEATIQATAVPPEGGGGPECPFDADFIELANASEKRNQADQLMTEGSVVTGFDYPFNNLTVPEALGEIWVALFHTGMPLPEGMPGSLAETLWELVNGRHDPAVGPWSEPSGVPLMHQLDEIRADLNDLRTGADWGLDDLALVLGGSPVKSHADILNAIGSSVDYSSVVDAITQLRGDNLATVRNVLLQLATIRTGGFYTLGDVMEAISGLGSGISVDLGPILTKLHEIQPNEAYDLTTLTSLLVNLGNVTGAISNSLTSYRTPNSYTVQHILDAIAALRTAVLAAIERVRVPPIWPGAENVQLGAAYDLSTTAVVTEPMDGVLVDITGTDPGTSFFQYQGMRAWRHIGGLTFFQEGGYCETHQALGFSSAIYVPKTMHRASGVRLFLGHGPQGTLRPWTIL